VVRLDRDGLDRDFSARSTTGSPVGRRVAGRVQDPGRYAEIDEVVERRDRVHVGVQPRGRCERADPASSGRDAAVTSATVPPNEKPNSPTRSYPLDRPADRVVSASVLAVSFVPVAVVEPEAVDPSIG